MGKTQDYWNDRYASGGDSGYGSVGEQAEIKLKVIKEHVKNPSSIVDIGCGDFQFGERLCKLFPKARYIGYDISDVVIEQNKEKYPGYTFLTPCEKGYPRAALVLCIDVIFHLISDEEQEELLQQLEKSWMKYLVITAVDGRNDVSRFGTPLVKELIEEGDQKAYIYLWKK